jgi:DNA modification methylase
MKDPRLKVATSAAHSIASSLRIVMRPIETLTPDPKNARRHPPKQVRQLAASIATFGFIVPVLVDRHDRVVSGHGRLLAARELGITEVPTIRIDHLSDAERRAFQIADNELTTHAEWDEVLLAEQLSILSATDLDFDIEVTGFELPAIDLLLQGNAEKSASADPDDAPVESGPAVSRAGDIWQLGQHRVACGSALDVATYAELMGSDRATMVFSDPPWNLPIQGHVGGLGKRKHREFIQGSGEMTDDEFARFIRDAYALMVRYSVDGSLHYIATDWRHLRTFLEAGDGLYTEVKNLCVWNKGTGSMGSQYRSQHELFVLFKSGTAPHVNNIQLGRFGRTRTNVWDYPGMNSFARASEEGNLLDLHPSVKPVALVADAILDASHRGDLVLDPFLGSGSTLIAAERTGRVCRGIELDPAYVDVAVRRWERASGRSARHATLPLTFSEVQEMREVTHG